MDRSMIQRMSAFASHTLAAGAGWALVMAIRSALPAPAAGRDDSPTEMRSMPAKARVREPWQGEGGRLLRELERKLGDFRDIPPAADRAAAALAAMQALRANPDDPALLREASARLAHWLESDPKAAMASWDSHALGFGHLATGPFATVLARAVANADLATLRACLQLPGPGHFHLSFGSRNTVLLPIFAKSLAGAGSAAKLEETLKTLHPSDGSVLLYQAIRAWPEPRLDALAPLLPDGSDTAAVTTYFQRLPGSRQRDWLLARYGGDVPADPAQAARLRSLLTRATALPLQERIEWMARLDQANGRTAERTTGQEHLVREDVVDWLNRMNQEEDEPSGDWRHRLRHGQLSAGEVLAEARRALPDAAASEPALLLRTVFQHVAPYQPEGAMALLAGLPVEEREKLMLDSAFLSAGAANPQALLDLVSTLPPHSDSNANERFRVWVRAANPGVGRFGDSYGAWIMALPHGVERDMALSGLASHFAADDPQAAATYRAAKTLPEGWKPGRK